MPNHNLTIFAAIGLLVALLSAAGCSPSGYAINSVMVPVIENSRDAALASDDVELFRDAAPANLFLVEGLIGTEPENVDLRVGAGMLYFSYAFAFLEDDDPDRASRLYHRGFLHGWAGLQRNKKIPRDWDVPFAEFALALEDLRKKDVPAATWTAANRAQFISIHLDSTAVLRDIAKVTALLERCAELDGDYFGGLVHIMIGSLHSFRPPMMGGDPEASLASFERAFAAAGDDFLLAKYFLARFYHYRIQDADAFEKTLSSVIGATISDDDPFRLLNIIARRKAATLIGEIDELF